VRQAVSPTARDETHMLGRLPDEALSPAARVDAAFPAGTFDLILADPPWDFQAYSAAPNGRKLPYRSMDLPSLLRLPVAKLAARDSVLAIWVNDSEPEQTLKLIDAWGFKKASRGFGARVGFTWFKATKDGKSRMTLGHSVRHDNEQLWLATRGERLKVVAHDVRQSIFAPLREHSRKPDQVYSRLERLYGECRRIELFARYERAGWTQWGNEALLPSDPPVLFDRWEDADLELEAAE
jgi:N6-adenosine-specific RNA methylase IME4